MQYLDLYQDPFENHTELDNEKSEDSESQMQYPDLLSKTFEKHIEPENEPDNKPLEISEPIPEEAIHETLLPVEQQETIQISKFNKVKNKFTNLNDLLNAKVKTYIVITPKKQTITQQIPKQQNDTLSYNPDCPDIDIINKNSLSMDMTIVQEQNIDRYNIREIGPRFLTFMRSSQLYSIVSCIIIAILCALVIHYSTIDGIYLSVLEQASVLFPLIIIFLDGTKSMLILLITFGDAFRTLRSYASKVIFIAFISDVALSIIVFIFCILQFICLVINTSGYWRLFLPLFIMSLILSVFGHTFTAKVLYIQYKCFNLRKI